MLGYLRQFGSPSWIVKSTDFPHFLDMAYGHHFFGEVWLYNNDLEVITDSKNTGSFRDLYYNRIAGSLSSNIDAVKILVAKKYERKVFVKGNKIPHFKLFENLREIARKKNGGGNRRLLTFFFGKMSEANLPKNMRNLPGSFTLIFYTHRNNLNCHPGIVMVRHNIFPFYDKGDSDRFAIVWQLREQDIIQQRLKNSIEACFNKEENFYHIGASKSKSELKLVKGWSRVYVNKLRRRNLQDCIGLSLGDSVDIAVLASQDIELKYLEKLLSKTLPTPIENGAYRYALVGKGTRTKKILLAVIGEGNLAGAAMTWDVITKWNPKYIILVGVAGGDPKHRSLKRGDVVIAEMVIGYEHGEITDKGFNQISTRWDAEPTLYKMACRLMRKWPKDSIPDRPSSDTNKPKTHTFPIASGSKLVISPRFFAKNIQRDTISKIRATDMEADGVGYSAENHLSGQRKILVIKSIMDKSDLQTRLKNPTRLLWKEYACKTAGRFVYDLIRSYNNDAG